MHQSKFLLHQLKSGISIFSLTNADSISTTNMLPSQGIAFLTTVYNCTAIFARKKPEKYNQQIKRNK